MHTAMFNECNSRLLTSSEPNLTGSQSVLLAAQPSFGPHGGLYNDSWDLLTAVHACPLPLLCPDLSPHHSFSLMPGSPSLPLNPFPNLGTEGQQGLVRLTPVMPVLLKKRHPVTEPVMLFWNQAPPCVPTRLLLNSLSVTTLTESACATAPPD